MPANNDNELRLTSPAQIAGLLKRLHEEHSLLSCSFPNDPQIFNSALLGVDTDAGSFTLDELNPQAGHKRLKPGSQLRVEGSLQGVDTRFLVQVEEILLADGIHYYRCPLPDYVLYLQRREFHRVPVRLTLQAALSFGAAGRTKARLLDLSAGGVGGVVIGGEPLVQGSVVPCTIQLPGQRPLKVTVEVRFVGLDERGQQRFGAMFKDISPQDRRRIARTVMDLERELRRLS